MIIESQSMVILYYPVDAVDLFLKFGSKYMIQSLMNVH